MTDRLTYADLAIRLTRARPSRVLARQGITSPAVKVSRNTYAYRVDPDTIAVRLHRTDIIRLFADGSYSLNTGAWFTRRTASIVTSLSAACFRTAPGSSRPWAEDGAITSWERDHAWTPPAPAVAADQESESESESEIEIEGMTTP